MGREVKLQFDKNFHLSLKVFKLEGSSDFYLFVKYGRWAIFNLNPVNPYYSHWKISSNLDAEKRYIRSGSAGQACPAHPKSKFNKRYNPNDDWSFNKAKENDAYEDWEEGGVVVRCTVHKHCSN